MQKLFVKSTENSPSIICDYDAAFIEIQGRSVPENPVEFYRSLVDWINVYSENPKPKTKVDFKLDYINTSSSKCFLEIFKSLKKIHNAGAELDISWYYEEDDDDMMETGEDYRAIVNLPFTFIEVPE